MRIITLNVNGIRSAASKGFFNWLPHQGADVVCLQEVRAHDHQIDEPLYRPQGYHCYYVAAQKKGYSGVAIYTKQKPVRVVERLGYALADEEGRYVEVQFEHVAVASLYLPSGTSGEVRQAEKYRLMDFYGQHLKARCAENVPLIVAGDWNIAHTQKDIKNWRGNQKNSGFLPEERAWIDMLIETLGYCDAFRVVNQAEHQYSWWSNRGRAFENNVGWRIDYQLASGRLKQAVQSAQIFTAERFSDHAPVIIDYAIPT